MRSGHGRVADSLSRLEVDRNQFGNAALFHRHTKQPVHPCHRHPVVGDDEESRVRPAGNLAQKIAMSPDYQGMEHERALADLRERIEIVHTAEYPAFLRALFPAFRELLLNRLPVSFVADAPEARFRLVLLEVLNRLPNNETLRPHVQSMLSLCMKLLEIDNEENAVICLRIIFDLHKNFRPTLEREVQPFLDFVQRIYHGLPETVRTVSGRPW